MQHEPSAEHPAFDSSGRTIVDSSILIDCLRGNTSAVAFLAAFDAAATHVMVAAELFAGARDKREQGVIESFLSGFEVLAPDESDARAALELFKKFRLSHGVDWPDCQIAATALRLGVEIHTLNVKHFSAFAGVRITKPY